ncbi:MAG: hypothetical protein WHS44_00250 [Fimbriimonadales bacterium]
MGNLLRLIEPPHRPPHRVDGHGHKRVSGLPRRVLRRANRLPEQLG